jgi:Nickel responsive protein SCO4226-like
MELVLVERRFDQPVTYEDIQGQELAGSWCLDTYHVRFLKTFFSKDRRRMLCLYEAPDAESVRLAEAQVKMPFDCAWTCHLLQGGEQSLHPSSKEYVVVERSFPEPITKDFVATTFCGARGCMELHRASYLESFLGYDGHKMVCVFRAPDAEAVRTANSQAGVPYTDVWTASLHTR